MTFPDEPSRDSQSDPQPQPERQSQPELQPEPDLGLQAEQQSVLGDEFRQPADAELGDSGAASHSAADPKRSADVLHLNRAPVTVGWSLVLDWGIVIVWLAVTDFLVFRHSTFFTWSLLIVFTATALPLAKKSIGNPWTSVVIACLMFGIAIKLYWCGSLLQVLVGIVLILAYGMSLSGTPPFLPELIAFFAWCVAGAMKRLASYRLGRIQNATGNVQPLVQLQYTLPLIAVGIFGTIFVLANPNLADSFIGRLQSAWAGFQKWASQFSFPEVVFWFFSGCVILGLLYPAKRWLLPERRPTELDATRVESSLFVAYRNTLFMLIVLFIVYLVYEFSTLWFRSFPEDFYYAGYAHRGAFWLTLALALATVVLSTVFQGTMLRDPRLAQLKRLAHAWSVLNFVLAISVYNRLWIYVDFNGLTRMRIVGVLGITCVIAGFSLVVWKLARDRGFVWLIHRQLWVPVLGLIVYCVLPVDWIVNRFNVAQVLEGKNAASVQIAAHDCRAAGVLPLVDLADHPQIEIREGVRALLALWASKLELPSAIAPIDLTGTRVGPPREGSSTPIQFGEIVWESEFGHSSPWIGFQREPTRVGGALEFSQLDFQIADQRLSQQLEQLESKWIEFARAPEKRDQALNTFFRYTYQWY